MSRSHTSYNTSDLNDDQRSIASSQQTQCPPAYQDAMKGRASVQIVDKKTPETESSNKTSKSKFSAFKSFLKGDDSGKKTVTKEEQSRPTYYPVQYMRASPH